MIITAEGVKYEVQFYHDPAQDDTLDSRNTFCQIFDAADYDLNADAIPLSEGVSRCMFLDNFSFAIGRETAFERAVSSFPRRVRKEFWAEYKKNFKLHENENTRQRRKIKELKSEVKRLRDELGLQKQSSLSGYIPIPNTDAEKE